MLDDSICNTPLTCRSILSPVADETLSRLRGDLMGVIGRSGGAWAVSGETKDIRRPLGSTLSGNGFAAPTVRPIMLLSESVRRADCGTPRCSLKLDLLPIDLSFGTSATGRAKSAEAGRVIPSPSTGLTLGGISTVLSFHELAKSWS